MKDFIYSSILKDEIMDFLSLRESQGYKYKNRFIWQSLDKYLVSIGATKKELSSAIVEGWMATSCKEYQARTVNTFISYYNSLAGYLNSTGLSAFKMEYILRQESYAPHIFSLEEINLIFTSADNGKIISDKLSKVQMPILLRILYGTGLRLGESLALRICDLDLEQGVIKVWNAKGNKDRLVPMHESLTKTLIAYFEFALAGRSQKSYLFESNYVDGRRNCIGKPRSPSWAHRNFERILNAIGIVRSGHIPNAREVCLHCLRHTFAVHSFRKQDLAEVDQHRSMPLLSIYLGHYSLTSTEKYLHMTSENSIDVLNKTNEYSKGLFPGVPNEK